MIQLSKYFPPYPRISERELSRKTIKSCLFQFSHRSRNWKSNNSKVISCYLFHKNTTKALYPISTSFIKRFTCVKILMNFFLG